MSATKTLSSQDDGSTAVVAPGDVVEIRLAENPTTGFRWELTPIAELAVNVRDTYLPLGGGVGSGGERVFQIIPLVPGCSHVQLTLRRSWEPPEKAAQQFTVSIVAR